MSFTRTAVRWLGCAWLASAALALFEGVCVVALSPLAFGSPGMLLPTLAVSAAALLVWACPMAVGCAWIEHRWRDVVLRALPSGSTLIAASTIAVLGTTAAHLLHARVDPLHYEFTAPIRAIADMALVVALGVITLIALGAAQRWLQATRLAEPRASIQIAAFIAAALALAVVALLHFATSVVYDHTLDHAGSIIALLLMVIAMRPIAGVIESSPAKTAGALGLTALVGVLSTQHTSAGYLIATRAPLAATALRPLRAVMDFDRDGSVGPLLGGEDCAPFDPKRAPAMREQDRDHDRDCRPALPKARLPRGQGPWTTCLAALKQRSRPLSVVILSLDALRADTFVRHVSGSLREVLASSATFQRAYAPSPNTSSSVPAFFSGKFVSDLSTPNPLRDPTITAQHDVVRRFRDAGYHTVAVTLLRHDELGDGFVEFGGFGVDPSATPTGKGDFYSGALTAQALQRVAAAAGKPLFLWLHQTDTHAPAMPIGRDVFPNPEGSDYERASAYSLLRSAVLFERVLRQQGDDTVLVLTSDHGEELGSNGRFGHGPELSEAVLRVPLLLRVPGCPGLSLPEPVSLVELGPALLELANLEAQGGAEGWSLLDVIAGTVRPYPVVAESLEPRRHERAVISGDGKLRIDVATGSRVAFDLAQDPEEARNVYGSNAALTEELERAYDAWLGRHLR